MSESTKMFLIYIVKIRSSNTETLISQTFKMFLMMLFHTKCPWVVTGTTLNITEQEIVDVKRNFRLHPLYTGGDRPYNLTILQPA